MVRPLLLSVALLLLVGRPAAQDPEVAKFIAEFAKAFEFKDEKLIDKLVKNKPDRAWRHFQDLRVEIWTGKKEVQPQADALKASWARAFENAPTLEKVERWVESQSADSYQAFLKVQGNVFKVWNLYLEAAKGTERAPFEFARDKLVEVAQQMEQTGHKLEAADAWNYVAVCLSKIPDRTIEDRRQAIQAIDQFVTYREAWSFTADASYVNNAQFVKAEKARIEQAQKDQDKRKAEGYGDTAKGIDALVMPGVAEEAHELQFEMLPAWDVELDYSPKGGPVPAFWWSGSFDKDATAAKLSWFRRQELHLVRLGATKFGVSTAPDDAKRTQPVEAGGKAKPSLFHLDADKKIPYAMFFWLGTDRERLGEAEINMAPGDFTPVHYHSAASWKTTLGGEPVVLYDDNATGWPMDGDPFEGKLPLQTIGRAGAEAPLLDSMRVGKGPRVPYSEFVKAGTGWFWLHRSAEGKVGSKPLNPDYCKLGKVKLTWSGPKPTAPAQLVIQGRGDFKSACFDVASGKEVEVPAGEYQVIWGRIVQGKGDRTQMATIYALDNKPFTVEAGKTFALDMGAPFKIGFERAGGDTDIRVDATKIVLREKTGCALTELQGMVLAPEVLAAKSDDGKGAKTIGKFVKLTDGDFLNLAAKKNSAVGLLLACFPKPEDSRDGSMELTAKLPAAGMKVSLTVKKHPLFGKLDSDWQ